MFISVTPRGSLMEGGGKEIAEHFSFAYSRCFRVKSQLYGALREVCGTRNTTSSSITRQDGAGNKGVKND